MIIFLYGRDSYRLKQNLDKIAGEYKKKHASGMSFSILDASDGFDKLTAGGLSSNVRELENLLKTVSFFNEKRLIIVKNAFSASKELASLIKKWGLAEDQERILVCVEHQNDKELNKKDKNFYAILAAKPNIVRNLEPLSGKQLENWIIKEAARAGKKIELPAIKKLVLCVGDNSWLLGQEINKLVNYKNTDGDNVITCADIDLLVVPKENLNIFEIVDAIANKKRLTAAKLIHDHLEYNADPFYIFSMIVYQFRNLLRIKDLVKKAVPYADIIKKTGLNPYVVKKTYDQCKKFELDELKNLFAGIASLDLAVKNGEADMTDGLYSFVFSLTV